MCVLIRTFLQPSTSSCITCSIDRSSYPSYYFIVQFIVMLGLPIHCLHQCYYHFLHHSNTYPCHSSSNVYLILLHTPIFDPSYIDLLLSISIIHQPCIHSSVRRIPFVSIVLIYPLVLQSIIDTQITSSVDVLTSYHGVSSHLTGK